MRHRRPTLTAAATTVALLAAPLLGQERTKSKTPPKGAPWTTDFAAAQRQAIAKGLPIFVYSTKTY
ncbi:MAG: hypothetical protein AB8H80_03115 [Planctomycetota bacterium]